MRHAPGDEPPETPAGPARLRLSLLAGVIALVVAIAVTAVTGGLLLAPLVALAAGLSAWIAAGRALRPVGALARRYRDLDTGAPGGLPESTGDDEIAGLTRTLADALERRRDAADRRLAFVGEAAQALQAPIADLRADLRVADADGEPDAVRRALADLDRLQATAGGLLLLARLRAGEQPPREIVPWFEVMTAVRNPSGVDVLVEGDLATLVLGARTHLALLMQHALDAAAANADGAVTVRIGRIDDVVVLRVDDDGPPVPPDGRDAAFTVGAGVDADGGLALAVVDEIVRAHGGTARLEESPRGGSRLRVELPAVAAAPSPT
ncbi:hypothetical protein AXK57_13565 [Tsukamurella pulmonis]|uniref:ATP-binding protein n=1 Tax=Tsukamurella pulmonis TaxID=47312 RepID=UPI00079398F4|nr:ATP-binding protein [Tsukamurella pulmonis]KXP09854.1 hypothetical protein AXK57_13565 [Tsukamurella pulmonis]